MFKMKPFILFSVLFCFFTSLTNAALEAANPRDIIKNVIEVFEGDPSPEFTELISDINGWTNLAQLKVKDESGVNSFFESLIREVFSIEKRKDYFFTVKPERFIEEPSKGENHFIPVRSGIEDTFAGDLETVATYLHKYRTLKPPYAKSLEPFTFLEEICYVIIIQKILFKPESKDDPYFSLFISEAKDPKLVIEKLIQLFAAHLMNENAWTDKEKYEKLKSALEKKGYSVNPPESTLTPSEKGDKSKEEPQSRELEEHKEEDKIRIAEQKRLELEEDQEKPELEKAEAIFKKFIEESEANRNRRREERQKEVDKSKAHLQKTREESGEAMLESVRKEAEKQERELEDYQKKLESERKLEAEKQKIIEENEANLDRKVLESKRKEFQNSRKEKEAILLEKEEAAKSRMAEIELKSKEDLKILDQELQLANDELKAQKQKSREQDTRQKQQEQEGRKGGDSTSLPSSKPNLTPVQIALIVGASVVVILAIVGTILFFVSRKAKTAMPLA